MTPMKTISTLLIGAATLSLCGCQVKREDATGGADAVSEAGNAGAPIPTDMPLMANETEPDSVASGNEAATMVPARMIAAPRIPPIDTCRKTGSFPEFRAQFETAVRNRDFALLEPLIDYDLETDFGGGGSDGEGGAGGGGMRHFADSWRGSSWKTSKLWDELDAITALGCGGGEGYFAMPRMFVIDTGDIDPTDALVALGDAVPLRARASNDADVVALLDWALVSRAGPETGRRDFGGNQLAWTKVRTADGTEGFVKSTDLRSPIDYRAVFQPRKSGWKMTAFIAGD